MRVADFGSGKGYLTFAIHDYLRNTLKAEGEVTGVELREDGHPLQQRCRCAPGASGAGVQMRRCTQRGAQSWT